MTDLFNLPTWSTSEFPSALLSNLQPSMDDFHALSEGSWETLSRWVRKSFLGAPCGSNLPCQPSLGIKSSQKVWLMSSYWSVQPVSYIGSSFSGSSTRDENSCVPCLLGRACHFWNLVRLDLFASLAFWWFFLKLWFRSLSGLFSLLVG